MEQVIQDSLTQIINDFGGTLPALLAFLSFWIAISFLFAVLSELFRKDDGKIFSISNKRNF